MINRSPPSFTPPLPEPPMLDQVAAAFDRQDYQTAARLLKPLLQQSPNHPWVQFYLGRLHEVSGRRPSAETIYRQLLRQTTNPKLAIQARQGLQRLETTEQERRQQAIAQATTEPGKTAPGFLILEAVEGEARTRAAQQFAQIMKLDAYTARLQFPSRGWRFYRTGTIGELQVYGEELRQAGVPAFWAALPELQAIQVFYVHYFQAAAPQVTVICENQQGQLGSLVFDWSEISQRVEGLLPIFEHVIDTDHRQRTERQRKATTQDYVAFCDLHLPSRRCILRLSENHYQFQQGIIVEPQTSQPHSGRLPAEVEREHQTNRMNWSHLLAFLTEQSPAAQVWDDFTLFADTVIQQTPLLRRLPSRIRLGRQAESDWDHAFHLYSTLAFLKHPPSSRQ